MNTRIATGTFCALFFLTLCTRVAYGQAEVDTEKEHIISVIQKLFDSMAAQDTALARSLMLPDGQNYAVFNTPEGPATKGFSSSHFIKSLISKGNTHVERMWNPTVLVHDRIAIVWAPYDFHRNGVFHHCGVDAFSLVKTPEGWKMAGVIYTAEQEGCQDSPLGPLKKN